MAKAIDVQTERESERGRAPESYFVPATDIYQTAGELVLVADMPGVGPEGLEVTVEDNVLTILGRPADAAPAGEVLLEEFGRGEFYRAFQLPADYDVERIEAKLRQGVLTVTLPKSERLKPRRIQIHSE